MQTEPTHRRAVEQSMPTILELSQQCAHLQQAYYSIVRYPTERESQTRRSDS